MPKKCGGVKEGHIYEVWPTGVGVVGVIDGFLHTKHGTFSGSQSLCLREKTWVWGMADISDQHVGSICSYCGGGWTHQCERARHK